MPSSTILLLDANEAAGAAIVANLSGVGYSVTLVTDPDEAFRRASDHHLIILDQVEGDRPTSALCKEIRGTPALSAIPVLCVSQTTEVEERIAFLEAGADDVIARPFDDRELQARVEALLLRFQRTRDLSPVVLAEGVPVLRRRTSIAVFSPKGGVGTTTIAVNIAAWLAEQHHDRVALLDLDLQFGQVATHLNITPRQTLAQIARDEQALREPELLRSYAERHESGLAVFAAPGGPEPAGLLGPEQIEALLRTASSAYEYVVVDAGSTLDERIMNVLEWGESIIIPICPEIAALKSLNALIEYLAEVGSVGAKASFVLNHVFAREMLKMRDVESALAARVAIELPHDPVLYLKAVNEGIPIVRGAPRSAAAEQLMRLTGIAVGEEIDATTPAAERKGGLLGGLRKRT